MHICSFAKSLDGSLRAAALLTVGCLLAGQAAAGVIVPAYSSLPGAPTTLYLDFGGFDNSTSTTLTTGPWKAHVTPAYGGATGAFTPAQIAEIKSIWAAAATSYAPFNVNVTTVDPAVAAGQAASDAQRSAYYDSQFRMMHTVVGGSNAYWNGGSTVGMSFVHALGSSQSLSGIHTNWIYSDQISTPLAVSQTISHENGHAFGLDHNQPTYGQSAAGTAQPIMASVLNPSIIASRATWTNGPTSGQPQNQDALILGNSGTTSFFNDGIGHTLATATALPLLNGSVDYNLAKGVIVPASAANPVATGPANYQPDYWQFTTTGGGISLTAKSGSQFITPGSADPGATLSALLQIFDSTGALMATSASGSLDATISMNLAAGMYFARVSAMGDAFDSGTYPTDYFDQGPYFLTGTVPEPVGASLLMCGLCLITARVRSHSSKVNK